jgi:N-methylhydantoinase A
VSRALNLEVAAAAHAVFASVNAFMADQITEISTKRGLDVREFTLVSGGGAGPVHAAHIAEVLGIRTVVVPRYSALYSAFGMFSMDVGREYVRSYIVAADGVDLEHLAELYRSMEAEALADLAENHVDPDLVEFTRIADMRYAGQYHAVEVPLRDLPTSPSDVRAIATAFEARHQELYSFNLPFRAAEFMLFRLKASVPRPALRRVALDAGSSDASAAIKRSRAAFMSGDWLDVTCYDADLLRAGNVLLGPALIEERTTTVVVPAGFSCTVDESRAFVLRRSPR